MRSTRFELLIYLCKGCNKVSRDGAKLDALVVEAVVARLSRPDTAELTQPEQRDDLNALREQGPRAENPPRRPLPTKTREVRWAVTVSGGPWPPNSPTEAVEAAQMNCRPLSRRDATRRGGQIVSAVASALD